MDHKITKERLVSHLSYDWYKYVLIVFAAIVGWGLMYMLSAPQPSRYEILNITLYAPATQTEEAEAMRVALENYLNEIFPDDNRIQMVQVTLVSSEDSINAPQKFVIDNLGKTPDILIMPYGENKVMYPEKYIEQQADLFADLKPYTTLLPDVFESEYYQIPGQTPYYGIDLGNLGQIERLVNDGVEGKPQFVLLVMQYAGYEDADFAQANRETFAAINWLMRRYR